MKITIEDNAKEIAALLATERLINSKLDDNSKLDERIRKICDEEFADIMRRDLQSRLPELVKELHKTINANIERLSESGILQNSSENAKQ